MVRISTYWPGPPTWGVIFRAVFIVDIDETEEKLSFQGQCPGLDLHVLCLQKAMIGRRARFECLNRDRAGKEGDGIVIYTDKAI